jgi:hypothetical protein
MIPRAMLAVAYATGRASPARQVKGDDPDKKGYPGPPGWGLSVRLTTSPHEKILLQNLKRRPRPTQGCKADDDELCLHHSKPRGVYRISYDSHIDISHPYIINQLSSIYLGLQLNF